MIFFLLVIFQIKHFLCDYPLQGEYMLGKFKGGKDWILPLFAHSYVHAVMTGLIALCVKPSIALQVALFDLVVHFTMDRIKASPELLGRYKPLTAKDYPTATMTQKLHNKYFWWALGIDQSAHHITHYIIIYNLVS